MHYSSYFIPTTKEVPAEAELVSHRLMLRAGMIRKIAAGIYSLLPLGLRVIRKVEQIIREEMEKIGAQEVFLPMVIPAELWQESGRWDQYGKELLRIRDRHERDFCLGPTHEEVITHLVRKEIRSYRQLPLHLFQIQTKFRDEIRPRFGVMRGREFGMKDGYSFHVNEEDMKREYQAVSQAYSAIFRRCGLSFAMVEADTGNIGGSDSHEFMVLADSGEDAIVVCEKCGYAANTEKAEVLWESEGESSPGSPLPLEKVSTPGKKTVEEVADFLGIQPRTLIKTLIYQKEEGVLVALIRGDRQINEIKLGNLLDEPLHALADDATIEKVSGAPLGYAGPVGLGGCEIIGDISIKGLVNAATGANEKDHHYINVNFPRDFSVSRVEDIALIEEGDPCPRCKGSLLFRRGIEVGHIFKLGTKYSQAMRATFLDEHGKERVIVMGTYGVGVGRTAAAAIEQNHDEHGIIFPFGLAPFHVLITPINFGNPEVRSHAEALYNRLLEMGEEVLLDDRDESPGVKFKDADLIGIPFRVTVGQKGLKKGIMEIKKRGSDEVISVEINQTAEKVATLISEERKAQAKRIE